ncbi:hypothetical protein BpHYR1_004734 [Brachionus plicatilis]|uniref:Uncharacterized protein n=1 Tax=Brachionus plicatilis TaxID=10195 RepID=A0A3M7QUN2_BRAPC|nr:hypothetical protein BpHYR1_004734 [Brachionus plicatilis]
MLDFVIGRCYITKKTQYKKNPLTFKFDAQNFNHYKINYDIRKSSRNKSNLIKRIVYVKTDQRRLNILIFLHGIN